jgi:hypothetical protein
LKRRETKGVWEDAGLSPLVRAGARWLSFARGLSRGARGRTVVADTLAFVESLYGRKFKAVEGGAFSFDKVYRTAGGGLFVSETRLSVSVHPRFDLHLPNVAGNRAGSQVFREVTRTTLLSHAGVSGHEQQRNAWRITNSGGASTSLTVQTWNVSPAGVERVSPAFGYVNVRGQHAQQAQGSESSRPAARGDVMTSPGTDTWRPTAQTSASGLRLTNLDLSSSVFHSPRQEFVSILLNTYLPAVAAREMSSVIKTGESTGATQGRATAEGVTSLRFTHAPGTQGRRPVAWTYAEPGGAVEIRREFRSIEPVKEHATARDQRPSSLQVLSPASLLSSLSETSLKLFAGGAGQTTHHPDGRPALSLQHVRTHTAPPGTREASVSVHAPRLLARTTPLRQTGTRAAPSSLNTFVGHVRAPVAGIQQAGRTTLFTRPGFEAAPRRGFERILVRQLGTSSEEVPRHTTSRDLVGPAVEFVRPASAPEFSREAPTHADASAQTLPDGARGLFSTQGGPGAGTFLFVSGLLRRATGAGALSPTAATALRLVAAAETGRALRETRAARPEGMALELVRQRREEVLQLPRPGYVFTQPARAQLEERQVITKVSREDIVEVVRREVRSLASSAPAPAAPSRADVAVLADEVYSTLVRRLLVEKERLGRF